MYPKRIHLDINREKDILTAVCGNRRHCIIANALRRQLKLDQNAYVTVDGVGVAFTYGGLRHHYSGPRTMVRYLRDFDLKGRTRGQDFARQTMEARTFKISLVGEPAPIPPKASRARKDQINANRNAKAAAAREAGVKPQKAHKRYAGV